MPIVSIRHRTSYRYRRPVGFGEHRMMLRPLEAFDQRLIAYELDISPEPSVLRHLHDLTDAQVAVARFAVKADALTVESRSTLEHRPQTALDLEATDAAVGARLYDGDETRALTHSIERRHPDGGEVEAWARRFLGRMGHARVSGLLGEMTQAIRAEHIYEIRPVGPPQSPAATLERGRGSCRDFAQLMIEAARCLGLAARFVSGYVYSSSQKPGGGHGHTHAWARVCVPGTGWVDFDPTNGIVGGEGLVRIAVADDPRLVLPLHGSWRGRRADCLGMDVEIDIGVEPSPAAQPATLRRVAIRG
jgi:transglutaminase-like putative cysteine protease